MLSPSFRTPIIEAYGVWLDVLCNMRHGKPGAPKTLLEAWKALVAGSMDRHSMKASLGVGGSYDVDLQEHPVLYWRLSRRQIAGAGRVADCLLIIALL
jgi:hypothetical protein